MGQTDFLVWVSMHCPETPTRAKLENLWQVVHCIPKSA